MDPGVHEPVRAGPEERVAQPDGPAMLEDGDGGAAAGRYRVRHVPHLVLQEGPAGVGARLGTRERADLRALRPRRAPRAAPISAPSAPAAPRPISAPAMAPSSVDSSGVRSVPSTAVIVPS